MITRIVLARLMSLSELEPLIRKDKNQGMDRELCSRHPMQTSISPCFRKR